ncbi:MAG: hypothetical protein SO116_03025 [Treponema sp.]|nr:hypothetical protein [Treponema sp.]
MKKIKLIAFATAALSLLATSCDQLQSTLSEELKAELKENTGAASYSQKTWFYNGTASENITSMSDPAEEEYSAHSLKIDFSQEVMVNPSTGTVTGKIEVQYTNAEGSNIVKTFTNLDGHLTADKKSYCLNMSDVIKLLDGEEIPTGTLLLNAKVGGFLCAAGDQAGRAVEAFEMKNVLVKPLYNNVGTETERMYFSTSGFSKETTVFRIPMNSNIVIENENVVARAVSSKSKEYTFKVSAEGSNLLLTPDFDVAPAEGETLDLTVSEILPDGCGNSYSKEFKLAFTPYVIVIDGIEDENYSAQGAASCTDPSDDGEANKYPYTKADFTKLSVTNDETYLYIGLSGTFGTTWYEFFSVMISKDSSSDVTSKLRIPNIKVSNTIDYGFNGLKPDFFMYHRPSNEKAPKFGAYVENNSNNNTALEVTENIECSRKEFNSNDGISFVEYKIPMSDLAKADIAKDDKIYLAGVITAAWDDGTNFYAADVIPDSCATLNETHDKLTLKFKDALAYTVQ